MQLGGGKGNVKKFHTFWSFFLLKINKEKYIYINDISGVKTYYFQREEELFFKKIFASDLLKNKNKTSLVF